MRRGPLASLLCSLALGILCPTLTYAAGMLSLKCTVFSILPDEVVLESGRELFHLRKDALPADQRKAIESAGAHELTLDIPMSAITRVRPAKAPGNPPRPASR